ncbi:MAG: FtsX-like permease family protein [Chloroflexota bacterium]|nr:FtsX-like permease family protein [Chloroflexota bacterium]
MMVRRFAFYLTYAARNLWRGARWSIFAIFCIGAGVATVVALRGLGLSIGDSLVANVRAVNRGDITLSADGVGALAFNFIGRGEEDTFSPTRVEGLRAWTAERGGLLTEYKLVSNFQVTAFDAVTAGRPQFVNVLLVDPATFPLTSDDPSRYGGMPPILAHDPAGVPISDLLVSEDTIVVSQNLADQQDLAVGDTVRVSNTTRVFTVTGIAPTEAEANLRNPFAAFFGFAYLNFNLWDDLQVDPNPNTVSILLPSGTDIDAAVSSLFQQGLANRAYVRSVTRLLEQNQVLADLLGRFIVIMGLGALLIGGVGIINTMLVMVGRRTNEIAALKTFGLKGRQVAALFLAEAALLGLLGSLLGCVMGTLLTGVVNRYGETFLQQRLVWTIYPEAIAFGMILGMVVTLVFGVLPVLTANRVRPAIILRPNETVIPTTGCLHSLIALLAVVIVIGVVAGRILTGGLPLNIAPRVTISGELLGIILVAITLLILGLLVGLLWLVVWFVSKLPSFGWVDLRLALRNLTARRVRTATTLLALSTGMFALSSISFVGAGVRDILQFQLTQNAGGNVLVFPLFSVFSQPLAQAALDLTLGGMAGIEHRTRWFTRTAQIARVDGERYEPPPSDNDFPGFTTFVPLVIRDTDNPDLRTGDVIAGRDLTIEDRGRRVMVIGGADSIVESPVFPVGSRIELEIDGGLYEFEIVGHTGGSGVFNFGQYNIPPNVLENVPNFGFFVLQVTPEALNDVLLRLSENPLIFALDITFIDGLVGRLVDQFAALPTLVGLLSLLAAGVAMANTVSLATLERRRQIGILKAVGLKGGRVLRIMLLENTLVGLLGGGIGIGLSALGAALLTWLGQGEAVPIPREALPIAALLLFAALCIAWLATFLSARVATRERVANVLRYE